MLFFPTVARRVRIAACAECGGATLRAHGGGLLARCAHRRAAPDPQCQLCRPTDYRLSGNSGYSGVVLRFSGRPRRPDVVVELLGTPREAQKQPGILPAHTATRAQHSPPLNVFQQQSTSSPTLHLLSIVDASGPASGTRHRAMLSG